MPSFIGNISLNISLIVYLTFLIPQIINNIQAKNIQGLSLGFHFILFAAFICDLLYGFGEQMQWQYKAVTIVGLICLSVQHYQIYVHKELDFKSKQIYWLLSIVFFCFLSLGFFFIQNFHLNKSWILAFGTVSQAGWITYAIPQIFKNYQLKSTLGISIYFVTLSTIAVTCDIVSAWSLNWGLPNKIGAPISLFIKLILLSQFFLYRQSKRPII
ncbi:MAG: PQ-loop repeat-containing protein [Candidatus Melainabacteria bacterium]|jgi:uncharacterized protein with PQ loop repeat